MLRLLCICYVAFMAYISAISTIEDLHTNRYPFWMVLLEIIIPALGMIAMIFYVFSYKPKFISWIWKIVPWALLAYFLVGWYFDFVIFNIDPTFTHQEIAAITIIGSLIFLPLLYTNFKFGYSEDL